MKAARREDFLVSGSSHPLFAAALPLALTGCTFGSAASPAPAHGPNAPYSAADLAAVSQIEEMALAPDGAELAYVGDESGALELYTVRLDGGEGARPVALQRTRAGERVNGLAWSPTGILVF